MEATSDVSKIVLNAKKLKIYENETTVEELSPAALENIFQSKHIPSKRTKRETIKFTPVLVKTDGDGTKDEEPLKSSTGSVMVGPQNSKVTTTVIRDGSLPHISGIDITDVKLTNSKPGNSPIKYIYYTLQKPSQNTNIGHDPPKITIFSSESESHSPDKVIMLEGPPVIRDSVNEASSEIPLSTIGMKDLTSTETETMSKVTTQSTHDLSSTEGMESHSMSSEPTMHETTSAEFSEHSTQEEVMNVQPKPVSLEYDQENNFVIINLSSPLMAGKKYRIQLKFKGMLSDSLTGFHRVAYRKRNAKKTR